MKIGLQAWRFSRKIDPFYDQNMYTPDTPVMYTNKASIESSE
jgi:hypothetical protein